MHHTSDVWAEWDPLYSTQGPDAARHDAAAAAQGARRGGGGGSGGRGKGMGER